MVVAAKGRRIRQILGLIILNIVTWILVIMHLAVVQPPINVEDPLKSLPPADSYFYGRAEWGLNHIFLSGSPFYRGRLMGQATEHLLKIQEEDLLIKLNQVLPNRWAQETLFIFLMRWFYGIEDYLDPQWIMEMYGVSLYTHGEMNRFANPLTRQLAYHILHEVAQMAIDTGYEGPGCTQIGVPLRPGWLVGRNFDFEGGRIFDEEKLLKWVFPETGLPYVSVMFAGMVGGVTGVNKNGVYIAINSSGSEDFSRLGVPATLLLVKALQFGATPEEAVEILKKGKSLISETFVVVGRQGLMYRIEKTPKQTHVLSFQQGHGVGNHFLHPDLFDDPTNQFRFLESTTGTRTRRAQKLADKMSRNTYDSAGGAHIMVQALRDKKNDEEFQLALGHRSAIDALIAAHSVVFNSKAMSLYVGKGPSVSGGFVGIDLERSFENKKPIYYQHEIPPDSEVTPMKYKAVKENLKKVQAAFKLAKKGQCQESSRLLSSADKTEHYFFEMALGQLAFCQGRKNVAKSHFNSALSLKPAYLREVNQLRKEL